MERKNYVKKEYCCPELSVIPVSAEPIMGTNSPFESDHKKFCVVILGLKNVNLNNLSL